jgi:hypothetical protein
MDNKKLLDCLAINQGAVFNQLMVSEALANTETTKQLIDIALSNIHPQNWHAAWIIDHLWQASPDTVNPHIPKFIDGIYHTKSNGVKRHLLKIISQGPLNFISDGRIIDLCYDLLLSDLTPIAVRAHAMELLKRLVIEYPELGNEVIPILEEIVLNGSKGEKNKAQKVISELTKKKQSI